MDLGYEDVRRVGTDLFRADDGSMRQGDGTTDAADFSADTADCPRDRAVASHPKRLKAGVAPVTAPPVLSAHDQFGRANRGTLPVAALHGHGAARHGARLRLPLRQTPSHHIKLVGRVVVKFSVESDAA